MIIQFSTTLRSERISSHPPKKLGTSFSFVLEPVVVAVGLAVSLWVYSLKKINKASLLLGLKANLPDVVPDGRQIGEGFRISPLEHRSPFF